MPTLLHAENLVKSYPIGNNPHHERTVVLRGVTVSVERGEILAIVGASGAGKSTLLHLLGALDDPDEGSIVLECSKHSTAGHEELSTRCYEYHKLTDAELSALRNAVIGFVFQFHHLLPEFTALENVMMPALIAGVHVSQARSRAYELLRRVGMEHRVHHKPDALSGGEQQRVAFARAMINNPQLILADEPTGNLDAANAAVLLDLMQQFRADTGASFVIVTHSTEVANIADRIIRLHEGMVV
ncbi:MAG: ABC transporter ATP-binding protein [Bacteroidota bacterium]|nr:ABC transporter ATP-binding protein [Candidatus Kapabacteria bacterium]MDW8220176.1 ABC transporter ATP-binding protein [Bacteroidota bacterium]